MIRIAPRFLARLLGVLAMLGVAAAAHGPFAKEAAGPWTGVTPIERPSALDAACGECASESRFCRKPDGACGAELGACVERPRACTRDFRPVCGCDGRTYPNRCVAYSGGVNVASAGPCSG